MTIISRPLPLRAQERRNAENPAETVPVRARARPRRLTEAGRDDDAVRVLLPEYPAPRLAPPLAVGVFCGSDFAKPGARSVGLARGGSVDRWGR